MRRGGCVYRAVDLSAIPDVAALDPVIAAGRLSRLLERIEAAREQREPRALTRQPERDRTADPRARTGDDDVPAREACDRRSLVPTGYGPATASVKPASGTSRTSASRA